MQEIPYAGNELELFEHANIWKSYYASLLKPYIKGRVLEVGAGIGGTTSHLCNGKQKEWICLEPDPKLYIKLDSKIRCKQLPACCSALKGTVGDLPREQTFDTILYIDVIEHISDDSKELDNAEKLLAAHGYLIVLVPAHPFLFSSFDKAIGHYRRYNKNMLKAVAPVNVAIRKLAYLDSIGLTASLVNKYVLTQNYPTSKQIYFWDKVMVRLSRVTDFIFHYEVGKTLIAVWQKNK
ncbi:MAG: class I SAM-dependent methyltransferase [Chitinophagaceae bacterium]